MLRYSFVHGMFGIYFSLQVVPFLLTSFKRLFKYQSAAFILVVPVKLIVKFVISFQFFAFGENCDECAGIRPTMDELLVPLRPPRKPAQV